MIRIQLVHEGRVVKTISSRVHESVVLEQVKRYDQPVDEIRIVEGELSEAGKGILHHVAKKIVPAAMAAGIALAGASGAHAQNVGVPGQNRDFPGLEMSVGQHLNAIFSPNYQEIMRQRNYQRQTQQQVWNAEQNEIRQAQIQQARERGRAEMGLPPTGSQNIRVYDQARTSNDGKYFIIYGMDNSITRIPTQGTEFMPGDSQRLPHYIAPSGQVFYVRHPAGTMTEGFAPIGTIPASGTGKNVPTRTGGPAVDDDEEPTGLGGNTPNTPNATATVGQQTPQAGAQQTGKTTNLNIDQNGQISLGDEEEPAGIQEASGKDLVNIIMQHQADVKQYTANPNAELAPELAQALSTYYGTEDFKKPFDKDLAAIFYQADQSTRPQQESIDESADEGLQAILDRYPDAFKAFKEGGDIEENPEFYSELYHYFADETYEMPYGVQKARDGDPYQWISDRLDGVSGSMAPVAESEWISSENPAPAPRTPDEESQDRAGDIRQQKQKLLKRFAQGGPIVEIEWALEHGVFMTKEQMLDYLDHKVDDPELVPIEYMHEKGFTSDSMIKGLFKRLVGLGLSKSEIFSIIKGSGGNKPASPGLISRVARRVLRSEVAEGTGDEQAWMAQIKSKYPNVRWIQAKMPGAPLLAYVNGKEVARFPTAKPVAEDDFDASPQDQASAEQNIIIQLKKASDNEIPQPLRLADGEIKISRETARKILDKFNQLRPASKEMMQNTLNYTEGFRELLNYFGEREVDESVDQLSNAMQPVREAEVRARRLIKSVFGK